MINAEFTNTLALLITYKNTVIWPYYVIFGFLASTVTMGLIKWIFGHSFNKLFVLFGGVLVSLVLALLVDHIISTPVPIEASAKSYLTEKGITPSHKNINTINELADYLLTSSLP
jgi:hypothetical protein